MICWHSYLAGVQSTQSASGWGLFSAHGLRNDLYSGTRYRRSFDSWRRPSWFAYRRLVWLLGQASSVELLHNSGQVSLVRLTSTVGFRLPVDPESSGSVDWDPGSHGPSDAPWRYAYVAWMDQIAAAGRRWYLELWDPEGAGYDLLSMVPSVQPYVEIDISSGAVNPPADPNGFAGGEAVDWHWPGWGWPTIKTLARDGGQQITVQLRPLDNAADRPAPICLLTDAVLAEESGGDLALPSVSREGLERLER